MVSNTNITRSIFASLWLSDGTDGFVLVNTTSTRSNQFIVSYYGLKNKRV